MKLKVLVVSLAALGLSASLAIAAPPPGKGKPLPTGPTCKPKVTVVLKGTLTGVVGNTLTMEVAHGNRWASAWLTAGSASVTVDPQKTKVRKNGGLKELSNLANGDRLLVQARVCKAELLAVGPPPALTAVRVVAHPTSA